FDFCISSRRRHTRSKRDWSSDVCSSDLKLSDNPVVTSPYSGTSLDVYYNGGQQFVVDYREDIGRIIEENDLSFETGEDVRHVLYEYTPVVPIYSPKITVDDKNRPIFMTSRHKSGQ